MRRAALAALLAIGCAGSPVHVTTFDALGRPRVAVVLEPRLYGRGCADVLVGARGEVWMTVQQDGTSDWVTGRAAPRLLADAVGAALAFASAPVDLLRAVLGAEKPPVPPPSEVHGCAGVLSLVGDEEGEAPPAPSLWDRLRGAFGGSR